MSRTKLITFRGDLAANLRFSLWSMDLSQILAQ
jgi:hypothetical protein